MTAPDLNGKVVLLTGGGGGLGRAMALGLADCGARVAVLDIDAASADAVTAEIRNRHGVDAAIAIVCDISIESDCQHAVERTLAELGGLHVLVNNAAIGMRFISEDFVDTPPKFWEYSADRFQALMDVNVRGTFLMSQAVVHHLMDQGAIEAAAASWAEDLDGTGVTVNVLIPGGAANTTMIPEHSSLDRDKINQPEVMIAPICWLASNESDGVNRKRFIGRDWDPSLPASEAAVAAGGPAAWGALPPRPRSQ